ncbi:MAG: hypothetical protein ACYC4L_14290 [Chloroflexota bacterium]
MRYRHLTAAVLVATLLCSCAAQPAQQPPTSAPAALATPTSPPPTVASATPTSAATPTSVPAKAPDWGSLQAKLLASKANRFRQEVGMNVAQSGQQEEYSWVTEGQAAGGNLRFRATAKLAGRPDYVQENLWYEGKAYAQQADGSWRSAMAFDADASQTNFTRLGALAWWQAAWVELAPKGRGESRGLACDSYTVTLNRQALQLATGGLIGAKVESAEGDLCVGSADGLVRRFTLLVRSTDDITGNAATFSSQLELWDFDNPALAVSLPANAGPLSLGATAVSTPRPANTPLPPAPTPVPAAPTATRANTPVPPPPTATRAAPAWVAQPSYSGDCNPAAGTVCLGFDDGYRWKVADFVAGRGMGDPYEGKQVQIIHGGKAQYHHVLGTNLVKVVPK